MAEKKVDDDKKVNQWKFSKDTLFEKVFFPIILLIILVIIFLVLLNKFYYTNNYIQIEYVPSNCTITNEEQFEFDGILDEQEQNTIRSTALLWRVLINFTYEGDACANYFARQYFYGKWIDHVYPYERTNDLH